MLIFFQIKRFFYILSKESFLFSKNLFKKIRIATRTTFSHKKSGIPVFHRDLEIKLDNKYYDFYSLQPIMNKPFYINSPLFLIIRKNKKSILNNLIFILQNVYDFKFKIGIELEFYILNNKNNINIIKELKKTLPFIENIEKEQGNGQFEIKTKPYTDILLLVNDYLKIIDEINNFSLSNGLNLFLDPLPFENDCGSSLQINLSIVNNNDENLFARIKQENSLIESKIMLNSIAGLLKNINNNLLFYIQDKNSLNRFNLNKNKNIRNKSKYPAPTFISWGVNNRTASIRIPTPPISDFENYMKNDTKNRRIEYRIPSSNADIHLTLIGIISSVIEGIDDNLMPYIDKTSFDVLEKNDGLDKIENDFDTINDNFKINKDILYYD